jgi:sugar phosphate isomerase/epimerase
MADIDWDDVVRRVRESGFTADEVIAGLKRLQAKSGPEALAESFRAHGIKYVPYRPLTIIEAVHAATGIMQRNGEPIVNMLAVAGVIVWRQAEYAGDSLEATIELMRIYIDALQRDAKIPKPKAKA